MWPESDEFPTLGLTVVLLLCALLCLHWGESVSFLRLWHFRWTLRHCCAVFGFEGGSPPSGKAGRIKRACSWMFVLQVLKESSNSAPQWRMQRRRSRRSVLIVASASPLDPRLLEAIYAGIVPPGLFPFFFLKRKFSYFSSGSTEKWHRVNHELWAAHPDEKHQPRLGGQHSGRAQPTRITLIQ